MGLRVSCVEYSELTRSNALYSVMVMSFTIGYGDYTPATAAGRVFWVCYALMAVPVVTNFAVQTVTGILYTLTQHQFTNDMLCGFPRRFNC